MNALRPRALALLFALAGGGGGASAAGCGRLTEALTPLPGPVGRRGHTTCLNADGPDGRDTYQIVESVLGPGAIESPDQHHAPALRHLVEEVDLAVGPHFVFTLHRDVDRDRDTEATDRQRLEIKVFDRSEPALRATAGATFTYSWRFKLPPHMAVSRKFTHLFQLKGVGGDEKMPLVTLTGAKRGSGDGADRLEVRHMEGDTLAILGDTDWAAARDHWLEATCQVTFAERGVLRLTVKKPDGTVLIEVARDGLDLWRDGGLFVRPKWGVYRSLDDAAHLNREDSVRFANFAITPGPNPDSDCQS